MTIEILADWTLRTTVVLAWACVMEFLLRRAPAAARHFVWVLALTGCLAIPLLSLFLPTWDVIPAWTGIAEAPRVVEPMAPGTPPFPVVAAKPRIESPHTTPPQSAGPVLAPPIVEAAPGIAPAARITLRAMIVPAYGVGVGILLLWIAAGVAAQKWLLWKARPITAALATELCAELRRAMRLHREVRMWASGRCRRVPLTMGVWRPVVVLPIDWGTWPIEKLRIVLLHELAHIKRWDALTHLLARVACTLYWFNPLVWMAGHHMAALRERAADDCVLTHGQKPSLYASTLLALTNVESRHGTWFPWPPLGSALPMARGNARARHFEARICAVLGKSVRRRVSIGTLLLLLAVAGAVIVPVALLGCQVSGGKPSAAAKDQATRIRECVYVLRYNAVWAKAEETYSAARELIEIGKPAVPVLCGELDRFPSEAAATVIAFTLRNIGDPRAVPSLITALGKTNSGSDCGDNLFNAELWKFVKAHSLDNMEGVSAKEREQWELAKAHDPSLAEQDQYPSFDVHRADREIIAALKTLTNHSVSDAKIYSATGSQTPEKVKVVEQSRQKDLGLWQGWWTEHVREFVTEAEMASMRPELPGVDAVGRAGAMRYGPMFPTGGKAKAGPVHEVFMEQKAQWDTKSYLDLDTGRTFAHYERFPGPSAPPQNDVLWSRAVGADLVLSVGVLNSDSKDPAKPEKYVFDAGGQELRAWQIENQRWESMDAEIASGKPLEISRTPRTGPRAQLYTIDLKTGDYTDWTATPKTFLFLTREGSQGILQILGSSDQPPGLKLRYRLWEGIQVRPVTLPPAFVAPPNLSFGAEQTFTLPSPASGKPCCIDLDKGVVLAFPEKPVEIISAEVQKAAAALGGDAMPQPQKEGKLWAFTGFNMKAADVDDRAWASDGPADVLEVLSRCWNSREEVFMHVSLKNPGYTGTFAFQTREGARGLLQVVSGEENPQTLTIRYKLIKEGK